MFTLFQSIFGNKPTQDNSAEKRLVWKPTTETVVTPQPQPTNEFLMDFPPNPEFDNPELFFAKFPPVHSTPASEPENNNSTSLGK